MPKDNRIHPAGADYISGKNVRSAGLYKVICCSNFGEFNPIGIGIIDETACNKNDGVKTIRLLANSVFPTCDLCNSDMFFEKID